MKTTTAVRFTPGARSGKVAARRSRLAGPVVALAMGLGLAGTTVALAQAIEAVGSSLRIVTADDSTGQPPDSGSTARRRGDDARPEAASAADVTQLKLIMSSEPVSLASFSEELPITPPVECPAERTSAQTFAERTPGNSLRCSNSDAATELRIAAVPEDSATAGAHKTTSGELPLSNSSPPRFLQEATGRSVAGSTTESVDLVFRSTDTSSQTDADGPDLPGDSLPQFAQEEPGRPAEISIGPATELSIRPAPAVDTLQVVQRLPKVIEPEEQAPAVLDREVKNASYHSRPPKYRATSLGGELSAAAQATAERPEADAAESFGPFTVSDHDGELRVALRRSKTLRSKANIVGSSVVDPSVCEVVLLAPHELSIAGKGQGTTHVTFWFDDRRQQSVTLLVRVEAEDEPRRAAKDHHEILQEVLAELFPESDVKLDVTGGRWMVKGRAADAAEATQILAVVRDQAGVGGIRRGRDMAGTPQVVNMLRFTRRP